MNPSCYHCGQGINQGALVLRKINQVEREFCCHGCAGVCDAIHEAGLESFYRRTPEGELFSPPPPPNKDIEFFDYDEVQSQYVGGLDQKREITLISEAIHCAACIWLIEHTLAKLDGVQMAKVNFTNKQIKLRWDNDQIKLSQIIQELNRVGYDATPYDASSSEEAFRKANRDLLYRLGFAGFAMMNVMWFSVALYAGADEDTEFRHYFHWIEFIIATITLAYSGKPFLAGAITSLKARSVGMDVSISLGILTTYFYSFWVTIDPLHPGNVYYDTMIDFMFLLLIGRYLEAISKNKAIDSTRRLMDLQPKVARLKTENGIEIVPVRKLQANDVVLVKPGDQVPVDGEVVEGIGNVNESMLSGESREVFKTVGSHVSAGTLNLDGALFIKVTSILQDTMLGKIVHMVEDAQGSKAPIQCTAEKIMPWFVSVVIALATLSFVYWIVNADLETAMIAATSVLIITCPCAFGLATPMATAVASGVSAQNGILIKNGAVLEVLNSIDHFVFDKTGTLTKGQMQLKDYNFYDIESEYELLKDLVKVEFHSEHSLGKAIVQSLQAQHPEFKTLDMKTTYFQAHPGKGVEAKVQGKHYQIGTSQWLEGFELAIPEQLRALEAEKAQLGQTSVWVAQNNRIVAILFLEDEIRDDAVEMIQRLKQRGKKVTLLSGDRQLVAETVAERLGGMALQAEVLPEQKHLAIQTLQKDGQMVAMVGDGINDAPAMARADVSIALGSGTDVSMDCADIVLLNNELLSVDTAIDLSERTLKTIKENIASSIIYNITLVPLAMAAMLTPLIAAITMPLSSLVVIGNAARIRSFYSKNAIAKRRQKSVE
ncbi:putative copper-transporting ATPase PacS [Hydrogenovibrio crunogenus]|uniref:Putative copper-transporting ATPase PacS n=1 Tax=Hydrogenovibrio crunogenus TaxID=39765 RepID=A0A4P7P1K6_9GAMM|nr:heavy metal translocating P-type ATPase [Hydrogenovibrio crunogenus]QBZ84001.1 putative copper-transporting ATPase PacS [Hydrogenovibrio crunogenus]